MYILLKCIFFSKTGIKDFVCLCGKAFGRKEALQNHMKNKDYKCEPGPSQSTIEPGPSQTDSIEPGPSQTDLVPIKSENGWQCPYCSYSTKRKDYVNRHIKAEHLGTKIDSWIFFFTFLQNPLYFHINVHEAKKDYKCEPGPSLSNFLDELNEQNDFGAVRLENGNWQCPICSYSHKRKGYVTKHIKTEHLGTKLDSGKNFFTFF